MSVDESKMKAMTPEILAHDIYEQAVRAAGGNAREASVNVLRFLTETLVYAAGISTGGDEITLKSVLKHLGEMITTAPIHPLVAAVTADLEDRKKQ